MAGISVEIFDDDALIRKKGHQIMFCNISQILQQLPKAGQRMQFACFVLHDRNRIWGHNEIDEA